MLTSKNKKKSKTWFDKKARTRSFEPGQEVLAFLPLPGNLLQAKFCGPYRILQKLGPVDYLIDTPNRRKLKRVYHVNLLQQLSYRQQIARQLRTQFVEGISVTLKSTLRVTQDHWKRNQ